MKTFLLVIVLCFCGCAPELKYLDYEVEKSRSIEKPFEPVWNESLEWITLNAVSTKQISRENGLIQLEFVPDSSMCDCGTWTDSQERHWKRTADFATAFLHISSVGNASRVTVKVRFNNIYRCVSTGLFERMILDYLTK